MKYIEVRRLPSITRAYVKSQLVRDANSEQDAHHDGLEKGDFGSRWCGVISPTSLVHLCLRLSLVRQRQRRSCGQSMMRRVARVVVSRPVQLSGGEVPLNINGSVQKLVDPDDIISTHQYQFAVFAYTSESISSPSRAVKLDSSNESRVPLASGDDSAFSRRVDRDEIVLTSNHEESRVRGPSYAVQGTKVARKGVGESEFRTLAGLFTSTALTYL